MMRLLLFVVISALLISCKDQPIPDKTSEERFPPEPNPEGYVCYRTTAPIVPDGKLEEEAWNKVPWTNDFRDIEGSRKPDPWHKTRAKVLWDDTNLYIAAELEEPHVWATLRQRDTVIFIDNDFEVFIDPDDDTHAYYEMEVNAFGTMWDLLLVKPYRDGGPAVTGWDIPGWQTGVHIDGTINSPSDEDRGWTVEMVIPMKSMRECKAGGQLPKPGDQWRLNFSRVEWRSHVENGSYVKDINPATGRPFPEENWVWSPQGRINMHMPEMWGYLQFSGLEAGTGTETFIPDPEFKERWALRLIYYAEQEYFRKNKAYTSNLEDLGLTATDLPEGFSAPVIQATRSAFECFYENKELSIYQDGRIVKTP